MIKLIEKIQIGKYKVRADLLYNYLQSVEDIGFDTSHLSRFSVQSLDDVRNKHHWKIVKSLGILKADDEDNLHWKWIKKQKEVREFANDLANWIEKKYIKAEKREKYKARGYGL